MLRFYRQISDRSAVGLWRTYRRTVHNMPRELFTTAANLGPPPYGKAGKLPPEKRGTQLWAQVRCLQFEQFLETVREYLADEETGREMASRKASRSATAAEESPPPEADPSQQPTASANAPGDCDEDRGPISLVKRVRNHRPRATVQIALVEFMKTREEASFRDIAHHVHGDDETTEDAIRRNVTRTNETLAELRLPIRFETGGSYVILQTAKT